MASFTWDAVDAIVGRLRDARGSGAASKERFVATYDGVTRGKDFTYFDCDLMTTNETGLAVQKF